MTGSDDATANLARLREEVVLTRKRRMDAQRAAINAPVVTLALDRASRDRSSHATDETDAIRDEIVDLWDRIMQEGRQADRTRQLFSRADAAYPDLPSRPRLVSALNAEAHWRAGLANDPRAGALRLELPHVEEIS
ncbi:hypothetical protein DEJ13_17775 (plasmid) [Curtobacterium sp. MCLR17_007]|uniref:hypothetical protein n=1 Tax=Curtobacterium sp. MCLR17_007 TaxID=2175648 RepID=UPI000DA9EE95|nr:hypothetical protein [Curtobacterium sp. MCLR17_007]WIB62122.1 hypothetical protein DEJ13_17775 [Curtobacterium sp. MCLR17_007]